MLNYNLACSAQKCIFNSVYPPLNTCLLHKISLQKTLKSRVTDSIWHPHPQTVSSLCGEQSQQWSQRRQTWHNNLKAQLQQSAPTNPSYHCNLQTCTHMQWCLCPVRVSQSWCFGCQNTVYARMPSVYKGMDPSTERVYYAFLM